MKVESSGFSANTILKKPECFANLLRFYDGICQWEEGSATPVLHIGWAKPLVNTISKFDADVRAQVNIMCESAQQKLSSPNGNCLNNNYMAEKENGHDKKDQTPSNIHPTIEALTAACSEKLLNPEYLLQGDGSPFVGGDEEPPPAKVEENAGTSKQDKNAVKEEETISEEIRKPMVVLHSQKMKELKDLLLAEKLNTHAISLHLTAQSQVQVGKKGRGEMEGFSVRPKRARRD